MATEEPMIYDDQILRLVDMYSTSALQMQNLIGGSSIAALGAILEEYNDRYETLPDVLTQAFADYWATAHSNNHQEILQNFEYAQAQGAEWRLSLGTAGKLLNPVMIDVGPGNIQIYTAINLLNEYVQKYPNSDPLGLKQYNSNYSELASALANPLNNATVKLASLMVEKGISWGAQNINNWSDLDPLEQEAFAVYFYNVGEDRLEEKRDAAIQATGSYNVDIANTDIAQEYLENYSSILERMLPNNENLSGLRELIASGALNGDRCFLATTPILMSDGSEKSIEEIKPGDMVKSYDKEGNLVAGRVKQTFVKEVEHVLDFFGTGVTPGHVYYCGAGKYKGQHVPLIDILRDDGGVVAADGTLIRAATGMPIGSENDVKMVWAVRGEKTSGGEFQVSERKKIRLGTRVITEAGSDLSVADILKGVDASVNENAMIQVDRNSNAEMPFRWTFSADLPNPEDYVLQRSGLTLREIHKAGEWEEPMVNSDEIRI